jgi:hypothetical protein
MEVLDLRDSAGGVLEVSSQERTGAWPRFKQLVWENQQAFAITGVVAAAVVTLLIIVLVVVLA